MSDRLLPPSATTEEAAQEQTMARIGEVPVEIRPIWDPDTCPADLLPWLAWSLSVDEWDENWAEEQKRESIKSSFYVHSHKGTVSSIRRVLKSAGYGDVEIVEGRNANLYDGNTQYHGGEVHGGPADSWAEYRVFVQRPISIAQSIQIRRLLALTAPVRSHLAGLHFTEATNLYNNEITYNGEFTHGVT